MNPTVLVVDDEPDVRDAVAFALRRAFALRQSGYTVRSFASGPELLAEIDAQLPDLRAVCVLDVRMEPMSGPAVHDALIARGLKQRTPVLFLSGHGDIPTAHAAGHKGAVGFIEKPHIDGVVEKVGLALAQEAQWFAAYSRAVFRRSLWDSLAPQQRRVALRVAEGMLNKQVAHELQVTERMVEDHRRRVYDKLGVDSSAGVATTLTELRADGVVLD